MPSTLSPTQSAEFNANGFCIVRGMYDAEEVDLLRRAMEEDPEVSSHMLDRLDAHRAATRIALWNRAGDSLYGMAARCARMVDTMDAIAREAEELRQAKQGLDECDPHYSRDAEIAYRADPALAHEAAGGNVRRAVQAMRLEGELHRDAPARAEWFIERWTNLDT